MSKIDDILLNDDIVYDSDAIKKQDEDIIISSNNETIDEGNNLSLEEDSKSEMSVESESFDRYSHCILSSGIYLLDGSVGGGIPSGSVVYITADAKSMSEVILYQMTQSRKTYYFCTERHAEFVRHDIANMHLDVSDIVFVDIYDSFFMSESGEMISNVDDEYVATKIVDFLEYNLKSILSKESGNAVNIIIDTFTFFLTLNLNPGVIKKLMNTIYETTKENEGLAFLYSLKGSQNLKLENDMINKSDVVIDVDIEKNNEDIVNRISIPKIRGMTPTAKLIKFKVDGGIQMDTSKDIA